MKNKNARNMMGDAKFFEAYSRYNEEKQRYETWDEAVSRVMTMHREFYKDKMTPDLVSLIDEVESAYKKKLFLGAQRALQFGGEQLLRHHMRLYNCSSSYCDRPSFFGEAFYAMLCGSGVGFSVQKHHVAKLPQVKRREKTAKTYEVPDSIEGWATALNILLSSFFVGGGVHPEYEGRKIYFDLTNIRPKGAFISGGFKAPGPEGLRFALDKIERVIKTAIESGRNQLTPIECYDIVMYVADAVISGGVRRSATICMFSADDIEMITAKTGSWFVDNPQRGRSNNSAVLLRQTTTFEQFQNIMKSVKDVGEPGFIFVDDLDITFNPCCEIGMRPQTTDGRSGFQVCNLTEINGGMSNDLDTFLLQCKVASIMGTLQAGYTDFKFLSKETKEIVEHEALIGVSITGWMNNPEVLFDKENMRLGAEEVKKWNKITADLLGIKQAARTCTVKPSGNASVLLGTSSGIHGEHSPLYLRHVQFNKETEVAKLFMDFNPEMCEDSVWSRERDVVVAFPVVSPETSIFKRDLLGVKQLEYVKLAQENWIEHGTNVDLCVIPNIRHNISNTITVDDWDEVTQYIYDNRYSFCGVSLLSASGDRAYPQAPFTEVLTMEQITELYGEVAMFTSALIEAGLNAFNNDLWTACNTALGYGEKLSDGHEFLLKRDFIRRFDKFALNFTDKEQCANCLKDVYNLHKWWKIQKNMKDINWASELGEKEYIDINTTGAQACSGGACELAW